MTLRKQTLVFLGISLLGLFITLYTTLSFLFMDGFSRVEQSNIREDVQRVQDAISNDVNKLTLTLQDWAEWDDMYNYVQNENEDFVKTNLNDATITRLKLRVIAVVNTRGKIVFSRGMDAKTGNVLPIPGGFENILIPGSQVLSNLNNPLKTSGIIMSGENQTPLYIASQAVLDSNGKGPVRGTLIMSRELDGSAVQALSTLTHFSLKLLSYNDPNLPPDFSQAKAALGSSKQLSIQVQNLSETLIAGYKVIDDITGKPVLLLRLDTAREVYQQGQASIRELLNLLLVVGFFFGVITMLLMEKSLLEPLTRLIAQVKTIGRSQDLSRRVTIEGKNELVNLAKGINQMLGALQNAHEKERADEERFQFLIERLPVGITLQGADAKIRLVNQAAVKLLGRSQEVILGKTYKDNDWKCIHEDGTDFPGETRPVPMAHKTKKPVRNVTMGIYQPETDSWAWILINAEPLVDNFGNITSVIASFSDITERKNVEALKTEFVSVVSHELRTPLTSIFGSLGLILGGLTGEIPSPTRDMLAIAYKNSDRLIKLINDILDIEKIEAGKIILHKRQVNLVTLVEQAIEATQTFATSYRVSFEFKTQATAENENDIFITVTDGDRLSQVLINLLSNAVKFSPPDETIKLSLTHLDDCMARISVTDKGPGIPAEFQDRIFQKFAQADSSATRQKGGTGLGLSISKLIMEKLKGELWFETKDGCGTTFYIDLPMERVQTPVLQKELVL